MIKISAKPCVCLRSSLAHGRTTNFFYVLSFFHHVNNKKCSYSSDHSCLSSAGAILYEALCYRICLRCSESSLAHMEISFQYIICCAMYTCKYICHRKIVTENLLVWMRLLVKESRQRSLLAWYCKKHCTGFWPEFSAFWYYP